MRFAHPISNGMKELQRRQKIRKIMYSWGSLILLAGLTFLLVKGAFGVMIKERDSAARVETLEEESLRITNRETELKEEIARLQTEEGVMEEIRDKFSAAQEGEYMAIIVDERSTTTKRDLSAGERIKSWWQRLFNLSEN